MIPTYSIDEVRRDLQWPLSERLRDGVVAPARRLAGFLFARPDLPLARSEIIPSLDYFHHRSGGSIDFFCIGYGWFAPAHVSPDQKKVHPGGPNEMGWGFSNRRFDDFRQELEGKTSWRYGGGTELLLTNAVLTDQSADVTFEWNLSIRCDLDKMKEDKAIVGVHQSFEQIFRAVDGDDGSNPAWALSDTQGLRAAGSGLKRFLLALLPKSLGDDVRRAAHVAITDLA